MHLETDRRWADGRRAEYERFKELVASYHQLRGCATLALALGFAVIAR